MAGAIGRLGSAAAVLALVAAGCGDDDDGARPAAQPVRPTAAATPGAVAGGPGSKNQLIEKPHIEDRVTCPSPDQPSDPRDGQCDPKAPSCGEHLYCLPLAQGHYCEPCPERDGIRHAFKERDFDDEHNRDPFQPPFQPLGLSQAPSSGLTRKCPRVDQLVAPTSSYVDLKLVGIVAQGTQRKVLMMEARPDLASRTLGWIIKRGDCVGKEKAVVKDIGTGYVTFQLDLDTSGGTPRALEEYSVQLNPKQLTMTEPELPSPAPRAASTPGRVAPSRSLPAGSSQPPGAPGAAPQGITEPPVETRPR
jgi:hypothetical protein